MFRRKNNKKKTSCETDIIFKSMMDIDNEFCSNLKNIYQNIEKDFTSLSEIRIPSILKIDDDNKSKLGSINDYHMYKSFYSQKQLNKVDSSHTEKKCGEKTLLNTRSKMVYPFDIVECAKKNIQKSQNINENIIEIPKIIEIVSNDIKKREEQNKELTNITTLTSISEEVKDKSDDIDKIGTSVNEIEENNDKMKQFDNHTITTKILSDIGNIMEKKKSDIKNDINIVDNNKEDTNTMDKMPVENTINISFDDENKQIHQMLNNENKQIHQMLNNESKEDFTWPQLSIEDINTTFKVIGDLKDGAKLKIVDNRYLAEDNSYIVSVSRYLTGQSKEKIMSFLNHLFAESKRTTEKLVEDIRNGIDVDNKVSELENILSNMVIFLHRYDVMRNVYKSDTGTHAKLGVIRNKFFTFKGTLIRKLAIPQN
jgi:hypothetical protein